MPRKKPTAGIIKQSRRVEGKPWKWEKTSAGRYLSNLITMPANTQRKAILAEAKCGSQTSLGLINKNLRGQMIPALKRIYYPDFTKYGIKQPYVAKARNWLVRELEETIQKNPYAQLNSSEIARKHEVSKTLVISYAERIRKALGFGGKVPKGGARIRYPQQVIDIIQEFIRNAKETGKPVFARDIIIAVAKKTRIVIAMAGIMENCGKEGIKVKYSGLPTIRNHQGSIDSSLKLLEQAGLKPGKDFGAPKRRRKL